MGWFQEEEERVERITVLQSWKFRFLSVGRIIVYIADGKTIGNISVH